MYSSQIVTQVVAEDPDISRDPLRCLDNWWTLHHQH